MADEEGEQAAEIPEAAPAEPVAEAPPAAPEPAAPEPAVEAPPAEAAAPPSEPAEETHKDTGAPQPTPSGSDLKPAAPDAPEPPAEAGSVHETKSQEAEEQKPLATAMKKGDSLVRTSSVSFNRPGEAQSPSMIMEQRRSGVYPSRGSRPSKDLARRSASTKNYFSMMSIKRGSYADFQERSKTPKYMNSYKLESEKPFNADKVHGIIAHILTENIEDTMTYDPETCPAKAKQVSSLIRAKVKEQEYDRYKLLCIVTIGEKKSYDIFSAVRFLWDADRDRFATYMHENMYLFATAAVFGIYYE